mmetsp:Transcript_11058/g.31732  ORF Transcript_11058/g.31732 Transcript_11058/m.31732 type:complete len:338 (-) Transcript_11058:111-1124(-)
MPAHRAGVVHTEPARDAGRMEQVLARRDADFLILSKGLETNATRCLLRVLQVRRTQQCNRSHLVAKLDRTTQVEGAFWCCIRGGDDTVAEEEHEEHSGEGRDEPTQREHKAEPYVALDCAVELWRAFRTSLGLQRDDQTRQEEQDGPEMCTHLICERRPRVCSSAIHLVLPSVQLVHNANVDSVGINDARNVHPNEHLDRNVALRVRVLGEYDQQLDETDQHSYGQHSDQQHPHEDARDEVGPQDPGHRLPDESVLRHSWAWRAGGPRVRLRRAPSATRPIVLDHEEQLCRTQAPALLHLNTAHVPTVHPNPTHHLCLSASAPLGAAGKLTSDPQSW